MWAYVLGFTSFILWPGSFIFMIYSAGRALFTLQWKMFVIALVIFIVVTIAEVIIALMSD